ncbi:HPr(Ser) kinase/phosphatase [Anaeropeptidivorans aminofermentans]|jgi:HPr kinase/phosphorylase|uniref:HPr(Ser) kinase/phosphatase n=1 Tax=Anaeropeptidivorans aminofermentans TaxID=2934315 RepID=UPI00202502CA|nr:HPr(Ser) kinase/phosphatase [Anaeropeptidivorans aminofermentans]MBE6011525.1 HPr(Ser) kinase/phosphatase [Lachnospiraceae bacterium]
MATVALEQLKEEFNLKEWTPNIDISGISLSHPEINRPALQLSGFFDYFDSDRIQIIGLVEYAYLEKLDLAQRQERLKKIFEYKIPCLVICRDMEPFPEMLVYAEIYQVPIFGNTTSTTEFMGEVIKWLKVKLAPQVTLHGVLVDIYGEGVLIMGESGIGKSEAALELIKRGHRLVADDAVEVKKVSAQTLIGTCPEVIRYFIELRGIGIIDVRQMFGVESVKSTQNIDLVIKLEVWDDKKEYDRLGLSEEYIEILGNRVVCHAIPIRPGRNLAIICESAAVNHRQKKMGYNAVQVLNQRIMDNMSN